MIWLLLILIVLIIIGILLFFLYPRSSPIPQPTDPCFVPNLVDISNLDCCVLNGQLSGHRYLPIYNMVVTPVPTYYLDVCAGFCITGLDNQQCRDGLGQEDFQRCLNLVKPPSACRQPALPVARLGNQLFYGLSATNAQCPVSSLCNSV